MRKHGYPKSTDAKGELKTSPVHELPEDDLEISPGKKVVLVNELHPRCGIDKDDADARDEYQDVEP